MFARKPGKGITLEMYIRNTQVNKKNEKKFHFENKLPCESLPCLLPQVMVSLQFFEDAQQAQVQSL